MPVMKSFLAKKVNYYDKLDSINLHIYTEQLEQLLDDVVEPPPKSARLHHGEVLPNQPESLGSDPRDVANYAYKQWRAQNLKHRGAQI